MGTLGFFLLTPIHFDYDYSWRRTSTTRRNRDRQRVPRMKGNSDENIKNHCNRNIPN